MTEAGELWLQIAANPNDPSLKQQYVDSLPQGDERAQPFRLASAIKKLDYWVPERKELLVQYEESLRFFKAELAELEEALNCKVDYYEGWPCMLTIDADRFADFAQNIVLGVPICHLNLRKIEKALRVFQSVHLDKIVSLSLSGQPIGQKALNALIECPHLNSLRWMALSGCGITDNGVEALAASPHFKDLWFLDVTGNPAADPVDASLGYGIDGITGMIVSESISVPQRGRDLEERYGRVEWFHVLDRFGERTPDRFKL